MGWGRKGQDRTGHGKPRRPESWAPSGPSTLRAYSLARAAAAEAEPSASWAFFCAASNDDHDDDDVEAKRTCGGFSRGVELAISRIA